MVMIFIVFLHIWDVIVCTTCRNSTQTLKRQINFEKSAVELTIFAFGLKKFNNKTNFNKQLKLLYFFIIILKVMGEYAVQDRSSIYG